MTSRRLLALALLLFVGAAVRHAQPVSAGDEWQPITPEELIHSIYVQLGVDPLPSG